MNENELVINAVQIPGQVMFYNYEEVKKALQVSLSEYKTKQYSSSQILEAKEDLKKLKAIKKKLSDKEKEIEEAYSLPYKDVKAKIDELIEIIKEPLNIVDRFIKEEELSSKRVEIEEYAKKKAVSLGDYATKVLESPAFKNPKWDNATFKAKQWQDEIDSKITQASADINAIISSGSKYASALLARYFETLSLEGSREFIESIESTSEMDSIESIQVDNQVVGYKVLKITATEDQMASLLNQMEIMGIEVEEIEDGMPREMEELIVPDFDSFVAFDIETTGTFGAANGDTEAGITEIGAVKVVNGIVVDKFDMLANPGREIVPRIARITHITNEMIKDAPTIDEVIEKFKEFIGESILIGHNIKSSDLHYISKAAKQAGVRIENSFLDTYILAKKCKEKQKWERLSLDYLAKKYGFEHKEVHRAWSDAEVNVGVYFELKKLY